MFVENLSIGPNSRAFYDSAFKIVLMEWIPLLLEVLSRPLVGRSIVQWFGHANDVFLSTNVTAAVRWRLIVRVLQALEALDNEEAFFPLIRK